MNPYEFLTPVGEPSDEVAARCWNRCVNPFCVDPVSPRSVSLDVTRWYCGACGAIMPPPYCAGAEQRGYWLEFSGQEVEPLGECEGACAGVPAAPLEPVLPVEPDPEPEPEPEPEQPADAPTTLPESPADESTVLPVEPVLEADA